MTVFVNRRPFVVVCALSLFLALMGQPVFAQKWADDMFDTREHNFGTVVKNADAVYEFKFTNPYKEDVVLSGVRTSCTCTTPTLTSTRLSSHEQAAVVAKFNTDRFVGQRSATITVMIEKPYRAEVQLKVSGIIRGDVSIEPGKINFGTVASASEPTRTIQIDYRGGRRDWEVRDVLSAYGHVKVSKTEITRQPGLVSYQLTARLLPNAKVGVNQAELILVTTDPSNPKIPLSLSANVIAPFQVTPTSLDLGEIAAGETVTKHVLVRSTKLCEIQSAECDCPDVEVAKPSGEKKMHRIQVKFTAKESGEVNTSLALKTSDGAVQEVPIHAIVTE